MDTRFITAPRPRSYEDFEPSSEWVRDDKSETLLIKLPGFKKEQMKVQIDSYRNLRTSGERPLDGNNNRWSRFRKDIHIPENLNLTGIHAKFQNETLHVIIPKLNMTTAPEPQHQPTRAQEPPTTTKTKPKPVEATQGKETDQPKIPRVNLTTTPEHQQQPTRAQEPPATTKTKPEPVEATQGKEMDQPKIPRVTLTTAPEPQQQLTRAQEPPSTTKAEPEQVEATEEKEKDDHKKETVDYSAGKVDDQSGEKLFDKEKEAQAEKQRGGSSIGSRWLGKKAWNGGGGVQEIRRQVLLNAAVTMFLLLALGIYLAYKAMREIEEERD